LESLASRIRDFGKAFQAGAYSAGDAAVEFAVVLGWRSADTAISRENRQGMPIEVARLFLGTEPAAIFAADHTHGAANFLDSVASYAYQGSAEWGAIIAPERLTIFNSHWVQAKSWYRLPPLEWSETHNREWLLTALTPDGFATSKLTHLASKQLAPDLLLTPVDDALVGRLDYWREETLRHVSASDGLDERLHTLFAQLFVLRSVEDRALCPKLSPLRALLEATGSELKAGLAQEYTIARAELQSELFDTNAFDSIPGYVLSGIIRDLYVPAEIPIEGVRYNFAWIDADVLGRAYQKYLSTVLTVRPKEQLHLFHGQVQDVQRASVRKVYGVYYTPSYLVSYLTESALEKYFQGAGKDETIPNLVDFSCGSGSFLTAAVDVMIRRARQKDPTHNWGRTIVARKCILGIDQDARAVTLARLSLWLRLAEEPEPLPLPDLNEVVVQGDSLQQNTWRTSPANFDIVLGNPPFIGTGGTLMRKELAGRFRTAEGRFDYSYLFIELAIERLAENGILALVVPNRIFRNRDANILRDLMTASLELRCVCDFGANEVFAETSSYVAAILAEKQAVRRHEPMRYVQIREIPERFVGAILWRAEHHKDNFEWPGVRGFDVPPFSGSSPWRFLSPTVRRSRMILEAHSEPLSSLAGVFQGITVGAKDLFVVELESHESAGLVKIRNGLGDAHIIEAALLRPVVYGSEIGRYDIISGARFLIYPYASNVLIPEVEMTDSYPWTMRYFEAYRDLLASRSSIGDARLGWYELVRQRDQRWLSSRKLVTRDLATEPSFAVDRSGDTFLIKGTAIIPEDQDVLLPLLGYLNSGFVAQYLRPMVSSFRAEFQKFEPQHISTVPVVREVYEAGNTQDELTELVEAILEAKRKGDIPAQRGLELRIDTLVARAVGITIEDLTT
jgi:hypothetical protein